MRSFYLLTALAFITDQLTKLQARALLPADSLVVMWEGRMWVTLAFNPNGFLSLGAGIAPGLLRLLHIAVAFLCAAIVVRWLRKPEFSTPTARAGLALISGGALGNLVDRVWDSRGVTDFLTLGRGHPEVGIFNFADVWLLLGITLVICAVIAQYWSRFKVKPLALG